MAIFGKTKEQPTFAERLSAAKSVFKQAFDDATVLNTELERRDWYETERD